MRSEEEWGVVDKRKRKRKRKRKGKRNFFRMVHDAWIHTLELPIPS